MAVRDVAGVRGFPALRAASAEGSSPQRMERHGEVGCVCECHQDLESHILSPEDRAMSRAYRGTSLIGNRHPVGPYIRTTPRLLWQSCGRVRFLMSEVPLYKASPRLRATKIHAHGCPPVQGYLAHKKQRPTRTLQYD